MQEEDEDIDNFNDGIPASEFEKEPIFAYFETDPKNKPTYKVGKYLGRGGFGVVKSAMHVETGEMVALKYIDKNNMEDISAITRVTNEINVLKVAKHRHLVKLYEVLENEDNIILSMEYCTKGDLMDHVNPRRRLNEGEVRRLFQQIVMAVKYLHSINICHRDLKHQNVLLDENKNVKLIDFGFSTEYTKGEKLDVYCGSIAFAAPEVCRCIPYNPEKIDVSLTSFLVSLCSQPSTK